MQALDLFPDSGLALSARPGMTALRGVTYVGATPHGLPANSSSNPGGAASSQRVIAGPDLAMMEIAGVQRRIADKTVGLPALRIGRREELLPPARARADDIAHGPTESPDLPASIALSPAPSAQTGSLLKSRMTAQTASSACSKIVL
ncbi:MAG TPA: hypothetical protein VFB31_11090 [Pseudolabrys sp.]|nr:hypothetical protein [Pseudolabrys sp.]